MSLSAEFSKMIVGLALRHPIPKVERVFFPRFHPGGQPPDAEFMALALAGGAAGISYVLLPDERGDEYRALRAPELVGRDPVDLALAFGTADPVAEMVALAAVNAICQHVMRATGFAVDSATDSLGLLALSAADTVVLNGSLDEVLAHRAPGSLVSLVGPTAGYFPDPLFARGIDLVGGRVVTDGPRLLERLAAGQRWGDTTRKTCFRRETYGGLP
ncbi:MAG: Rossmann-like domain-containing protein [Deferrisomatales bacterium]